MKRIRILLGGLVFWLSWPFLYLYLRETLRSRVIIEHNGEVLMIRGWHDGNKWALPGGGVHKHENPDTSAVREAKEEVGIDIPITDLLNLGLDTLAERGLKFNIARFGYKIDKRPATTRQKLEVIALAWIKLEAISPDMVDSATWRHLTVWKQHR